MGAHRETVHRTTYCLRRRFSAASIDAHLADAAACHNDRSSPTDTITIDAQRTSTARHCPQIKPAVKRIFFRTTFCGSRPLAQTGAHCSASPYYRARSSERSMNEDTAVEYFSRKGAKAQSLRSNFFEGTSISVSSANACLVFSSVLRALAPLREIIQKFYDLGP